MLIENNVFKENSSLADQSIVRIANLDTISSSHLEATSIVMHNNTFE